MSSVRLIAITQPFEMEGVQTGEELVAYCARVSNPGNQANHQTAPQLLAYLTNHQHWSPFEMVHAVIEINTTRDIARQILRHRSFSFQEFSQRYAPVDNAPVFREARLQGCKNRQSSFESHDAWLNHRWQQLQASTAQLAWGTYKWALDHGIAKEVARAVLPEGLTPTRLYVAGSIRSWIHYVQLRTTAGTQKEHREVAELCGSILLRAMPTLEEVLHAMPH